MIFLAGHLLGFLLLGIALVRTRLVPHWAGVAVAASSPLHFVAHAGHIRPLDLAAVAILAAGFVALGRTILRQHNLAPATSPQAPVVEAAA